MFGRADSQIKPRNGHKLIVGIAARISGCANQKELSLADQEDHGKQLVADIYQGDVDYRVVATKGKGERLDRPELAQIESMLRSRQLDLLVVEDIGRLVRGAEAVRLCGVAVDHGTRVLSPNDYIDTAEDSWEEDVISACRDHVGHNAHTSKRLKHKLMNRFLKFGGAMAREIFGYIVPDGAKTYDDWHLDSAATPIIREAVRRLRASLNCSAVAEWLNAQGVPVGPYCRRKDWDGAMVRRFFKNSVLKGFPGRGYKHTIKHHETGKRVSVKNPNGPKFREHPQLAHLDPDEFDSLNAALDAKNAGFKRKSVAGEDPLVRRSRKRTAFPGQHARCWYCGRQYVWGGNGITANLMCSGARAWQCWNSIGFSGTLAARRVVEAITNRLFQLDGFDAQFAEMVEAAGKDVSGGLSERRAKLRRAEEQHNKERENLKATLRALGPAPIVQETMAELDNREKVLIRERHQIETFQERRIDIPESIPHLRTLLEQEFERQAIESPEFGDLLRKLVPEFHVYLVRLCDGGHLLPRAKVRLDLGGSFEDIDRVLGLRELLSKDLIVDLFDPPQRESIRVAAVDLASVGLTHREIAQRLPGNPTKTAVSHALALHAKIQCNGLSGPFVNLYEPPADYSKLRRHKNKKYRFKRSDGYEPRQL